MKENYNRYPAWFIVFYYHGQPTTQTSVTALLHLFLYEMQGKKCCCIQRSAKSHTCRKLLFLSAYSFNVPSMCLLHRLYGTMSPSCSIIPCARGNRLATAQLVASSAKSQGEIKNTLRLFCIPGSTQSSTAELDHRSPNVEVPSVT